MLSAVVNLQSISSGYADAICSNNHIDVLSKRNMWCCADVRGKGSYDPNIMLYGVSYCSANNVSGPIRNIVHPFGSGGGNRLQSYELELAHGGSGQLPPGRIR
jgi:hypothetical protein